MAKYSNRSEDRLKECHQDLQTIFNYVIRFWDNTIITGHRGETEQNKKYRLGQSAVKYPNSYHNTEPSMAVDSVPYPSLYGSRDNMIAYGGFVMGVAAMLKSYGAIEHDLVWGHDWDDDQDLEDTNFEDTGHFQLR